MISRAKIYAFTSVCLFLVTAPSVRGQCCGDCDGDGDIGIDEIVTVVSHALTRCAEDGICGADTCAARLAVCRDELDDCRAQPGKRAFPASGQKTSYGRGSDGDVRAGAPLSYTDNADGTITDNNTGLIWEKKDDSGGIHDRDNVYTWSTPEPYIEMNGTMVTVFLSALNTEPCFAGSCDWRIPNVMELHSIVDYDVALPGPTVDAAFQTVGCEGCSDVTAATCSCTARDNYWSSTTNKGGEQSALIVGFGDGGVRTAAKGTAGAVRAVRGGS